MHGFLVILSKTVYLPEAEEEKEEENEEEEKEEEKKEEEEEEKKRKHLNQQKLDIFSTLAIKTVSDFGQSLISFLLTQPTRLPASYSVFYCCCSRIPEAESFYKEKRFIWLPFVEV